MSPGNTLLQNSIEIILPYEDAESLTKKIIKMIAHEQGFADIEQNISNCDNEKILSDIYKVQ